MVEWLTIWGVTQALGFLFGSILGDLAKGTLEDYSKTFFKDALGDVVTRLQNQSEAKALKVSFGKAITEFLKLIQQDLEDADYSEALIKQYEQPLKTFVQEPRIAAALGLAFDPACQTVDTQLLSRAWESLNFPVLPTEFDWERLGKRYLKKVRAIVQNSGELQAIFTAQRQTQDSDTLQELAGIAPDFDLGKYAEGLRESYGNVKLESLDSTGVYYNEMKLWKIFVPQTVRPCQEFNPKVYEIPKEQLLRLQAKGDIDETELLELEHRHYRQSYGEQLPSSVLEVVGGFPPKPLSTALLPADATLALVPPDKQPQAPLAKYAVILGDPGSGKSTLLQYLALSWADHPLKDLSQHPIPLMIELRLYGRDKQAGQCQDVLSFLHQGTVTCRLNQRALQEKLLRGQAIALFDGLDEVFDPNLREAVTMDIHRFTNDFPQVQVVITSRWLGYKAQRLRDAEFQHYMLQDLELEQIEDFIQRWHDLTFTQTEQVERWRKQERLQKAIQDSKAIRELAGNPLLLTLMAILNRNRELPRDRPELYNQASQLLLHQWDIERNLSEHRLDPYALDYRDKQAMLRRVAYHMQSSDKGLAGNLISTQDLERILIEYLKEIEVDRPREVARLLIDQLRQRNFILCYLGAESYAFVHRTFLEYFCASAFVWEFKESQTLTFEQLQADVFGQHWQDDAWEEVLRLIAGLIEPRFVGTLIEFLLAQSVTFAQHLTEEDYLKLSGLKHLLLAAGCLAEVRNRSPIVLAANQLRSILQQWAEQQYPYLLDQDTATALLNAVATTWPEEQATLAWLKACTRLRSTFQEYFPQYRQSLFVSSFIPESALQALARGWKDDPDILPWLKTRAQSDDNWAVRQAAVEALARGWKDDPDTLPMLKTLAQSDEDSNVRQAAVQALARGWKDDPDTLPMLKTRAQSDDNGAVRWAAVEALARGWKDDPDTLPMLKTLAQSDEDSNVRRVAVAALARGWKDDPDTLPMLKTRAQSDEDSAVRRIAVEALARGWKDDPDTLFILKTRAQSDDNGAVRQAAVEALARDWKDDPDTLPMLKTLAQSDDNGTVRRVAVAVLARGWKDDPDTLTILKTLAQSDDNGTVRQVAVQELAQGWQDDPDTLPWLKTLAQSDDNSAVRWVVVQELARGWKDDPDTLPWLKTRTQSDDNGTVRQVAVEALVRGWKDDPDTLPWLKTLAQSDDNETVRQIAVQELAWGWKDDPDTLPWLKTLAQSDDNETVRQIAVQELARSWQDDPGTLPMLKTLAQSDDNSAVRRAALQELARGWQDDPDTLPWLKTRAQSDNNSDVRQLAVEALARGWKDDPGTLPWLKTRAQSDNNSDVRQAAMQELAWGWQDDPDTLPWLKTRAQSDEDRDVRRAALQELARGWQDDPDTLPWLKTRAQSDNNSDVRRAALQELARGWKDDPDTLNMEN